MEFVLDIIQKHLALIVIYVVIIYFSISSVKLAREQERFFVYAMGKFQGVKGPGLLFKFPGDPVRWYKVRVGDRGELLAPGFVRLKDMEIPVTGDDPADVGSIVRVTGFEEASVTVMRDPNQRNLIKCEKCGHEMNI